MRSDTPPPAETPDGDPADNSAENPVRNPALSPAPSSADNPSRGAADNPEQAGAEVANSGERLIPKRSRLLGAEIHRITPAGKPPSQVTGVPGQSAAAHHPADLGKLPAPGGAPEPADPDSQQVDPSSVYAQIGGHETFRKIIDVFYDQVEADPEFRAHYPEEDLGPARERLLMFFEQYWGGPREYQQRRGHPRLRMRHNAFRVDAQARDTWLRYMRHALDTARLPSLYDEMIWDYCQRAAHSLVNTA